MAALFFGLDSGWDIDSLVPQRPSGGVIGNRQPIRFIMDVLKQPDSILLLTTLRPATNWSHSPVRPCR